MTLDFFLFMQNDGVGMNTNIYVLSGLGADKRVFKNLIFPKYEVIYLHWLTPINNETIEEYALRISKYIESSNPILVGLSFGGMMAIEVAKLVNVRKLILISTAKTKYELPFYYRLIGFLKLNRIVPNSWLKKHNFLLNWVFGVKSNPEKSMLAQILHETEAIYFSWAIDKIANWKNVNPPVNYSHIHGTDDKILPSFFIRNAQLIKGGGHLMVLNKSDEMNQFLKKELV
jgi:pimeloyl-ACP methyl ester carboxylesterase